MDNKNHGTIDRISLVNLNKNMKDLRSPLRAVRNISAADSRR